MDLHPSRDRLRLPAQVRAFGPHRHPPGQPDGRVADRSAGQPAGRSVSRTPAGTQKVRQRPARQPVAHHRAETGVTSWVHRPSDLRHERAPGRSRTTKARSVAGATVLAMVALLLPMGLGSTAQAANVVGEGFTVTPSDLSFILKQIKIAEAHSAVLAAQGPGPSTDPVRCQSMIGTRHQPDREPAALLRPAHRRRQLQQPAARPGDLRRCRPDVPAAHQASVPGGRGRHGVRRPCDLTRTARPPGRSSTPSPARSAT